MLNELKTFFKPLLVLLKRKRLFFGTLTLLLFLVSYWSWLDYRDFIKTPIQFNESTRSLLLPKGFSINHLAHQLQDQGLIANRYYLKILAYLNPEYKNLKAGEYQLEAKMTPVQLLTRLTQGRVVQYAFTIIEGQTAFEILNNLKAETRLLPLEQSDPASLLYALQIDFSKLEGWFYPETYYFTKGESALSILKRATSDMQKALQEEWQNRALDLPYNDPYEALIMASIIEKETAIASERTKIAGVFVRRLQKKMRLGTDPTVIYGIGPGFNGDITRKDLRTPTAYNTYIIKGLPPTPIAMPSREAIYAALHPDNSQTLYFVADGTGGHYFSETLTEHNQAVKRMLDRNRQSKNQ